MDAKDPCPCGSGEVYVACCGVFISGQEKPQTPEQLMRSRYTAYTRADLPYIARTMKGPAIKNFDAEEAETWARQVNWLRLEVMHSEIQGSQGLVEFKAHYTVQGRPCCLHERSLFQLEEGQWYYVDGEMPRLSTKPVQSEKISRNDPCPCGSGKKYKKCCST